MNLLRLINVQLKCIYVADDECGTNNTSQIATSVDGEVVGSDCLFVEKVFYQNLNIYKLFANKGGPKDSWTHYILFCQLQEKFGNQGNWRDTGF